MKRGLGVGLVLGASSGIGAALTRRLAPTATRLHAASRRGQADADADGTVVVHQCDVRSHQQVAELFEAVGDPIDFMVNCVGVGFYAPLDDDYSTAWRDMTETNLVGLANVLSVAYRVRPDIGTIINVSSLAAHRVSRTPGNIMYTATKTGARVLLDDYRRRMRSEHRTTRIMSISPGFVSGTDFDNHFYRDAPHARTDLFASDGSLSPDEVAELIEYMLMTPPQVEIADWLVRPTTQIE
jgi:NADP-dependent 3-hydroxy acid dehydrogenase YdfG